MGFGLECGDIEIDGLLIAIVRVPSSSEEPSFIGSIITYAYLVSCVI
jgi:hypothetical protein